MLSTLARTCLFPQGCVMTVFLYLRLTWNILSNSYAWRENFSQAHKLLSSLHPGGKDSQPQLGWFYPTMSHANSNLYQLLFSLHQNQSYGQCHNKPILQIAYFQHRKLQQGWSEFHTNFYYCSYLKPQFTADEYTTLINVHRTQSQVLLSSPLLSSSPVSSMVNRILIHFLTH